MQRKNSPIKYKKSKFGTNKGVLINMRMVNVPFPLDQNRNDSINEITRMLLGSEEERNNCLNNFIGHHFLMDWQCKHLNDLGKQIKGLFGRKKGIKMEKKIHMVNKIKSITKEYIAVRKSENNMSHFHDSIDLELNYHHERYIVFSTDEQIMFKPELFVHQSGYFHVHKRIRTQIPYHCIEQVKSLSGDQVFALFFNLLWEKMEDFYHLYSVYHNPKVNVFSNFSIY
jgi:hypothetical protein